MNPTNHAVNSVAMRNRNNNLIFSNVLIPHFRIRGNELREHFDTLLRVQIYYIDTVFLQPIDAAFEIYRFADDHSSYAELANEPAAVPARREGGDHDRVFIISL